MLEEIQIVYTKVPGPLHQCLPRSGQDEHLEQYLVTVAPRLPAHYKSCSQTLQTKQCLKEKKRGGGKEIPMPSIYKCLDF